MQRPIFNTILEVLVIDMVDHCGQGLFHHIAWQNRPIQIITVGGPGYLGIWEYPLDIPGTPSPDQQFSRATILAYDGQVAVVRHYPHLLSPVSVNMEMSVFCGHSMRRSAGPLCVVESRCGAVALGRTSLLPPLSSGGASM